MLKKFLLVITFCVYSIISLSQSNFEKKYPASWLLYNPNDIEQTLDDGFIIGAGSLIKTDSYGDTTWTKQHFNLNQYSNIAGVTQTIDGGYAYVLSTNIGTAWNTTLVKTNSSGDSTFTKSFGGSIENYGQDIIETTDGGYLLTGTKWIGGTDPRIYIIKTDVFGNELWSYTHSNTSETYTNSVVEIVGNKYVITGRENQDAILIKLDQVGSVIWSKVHNVPNVELGRGLSATSTGGFIYTGWQFDLGTMEGSLYLVKTGTNGDTLWTKNERRMYNESFNTWSGYGFDTKELPNGNIMVTGSESYTYPNEYGGSFIFYYSQDGDVVNDTSFSCNQTNAGKAIALTNDGGYMICNGIYDSGSNQGSTTLIKLDANLCVYPTDTTIVLMNTGDPNLFCAGSGFVLNTASACSHILWDNGATTEMNVYNPPFNIPGNYSATFTNSYGCSTDATIEIDTFQTVKPVINSVSGNDEICTGDSLILFVSDEYVDYWSGLSWVASNDTNIAYTGGNYQITVEDVNGCFLHSAPFTVIENPLPTPNISLQLNGDLVSSELTGNQWYLDGSIINGATDQIYTPLVIGDYTVEVTNANDCVGLSDSYTLTVLDIGENLSQTEIFSFYNGQLKVNSGDWILYDLQGRNIMNGTPGQYSMPKGVYILQYIIGSTRIVNL